MIHSKHAMKHTHARAHTHARTNTHANLVSGVSKNTIIDSDIY